MIDQQQIHIDRARPTRSLPTLARDNSNSDLETGSGSLERSGTDAPRGGGTHGPKEEGASGETEAICPGATLTIVAPNDCPNSCQKRTNARAWWLGKTVSGSYRTPSWWVSGKPAVEAINLFLLGAVFLRGSVGRRLLSTTTTTLAVGLGRYAIFGSTGERGCFADARGISGIDSVHGDNNCFGFSAVTDLLRFVAN